MMSAAPPSLRIHGAKSRSGRRGIRVLLGTAWCLAVLAGFGTQASAQTTYTWNKNGKSAWTTASNWTPSRNSPQATDILVFSGTTTATPTITNVPTQTIGRLRIINNAFVTMTATSNVTLTITGGAAPNLEILAGSSLVRSGASAITISLGGTATASISGSMSVTGGAHQLLGASASSITFQNGAAFSTGTG